LEVDDGFIDDRYLAGALHGPGLVFNSGERFNAPGSMLYLCLLLFVSRLLHG
jgi:hypothetical protein